MRFDSTTCRGCWLGLTVFVGALMVSVPSGFAAEDKQPAAKPPAQSLDDELLEDLKDDTGGPAESKPRPATPEAEPDSNPEAALKKSGHELDEQLLEDLKQDDPPRDDQDPLGRISQKMRRVQALIGDRQPGEQVRGLQEEIVRDLDRLMAEARKNSRQSQSKSSSSQASRRDRLDQPPARPSSAGGRGQASNNPARDSDAALQSRRAEKPDVQATRDLIQELWGHLPERDRQQVIQPTVETFLPKYELLITEYFKRLAEGARERRAP